jgi:DUF2917 family protein
MNSISSGREQPTRVLAIDQARAVSVRVPLGSAVHCIAGQVWLTQEGMFDDFILMAGEKLVVRQRGTIVMSGMRGAAIVYVLAGERADDAIIFKHDFLDAARTRAAELRREELGRLVGVAWGFVMRVVKATKAMWKNERPVFGENRVTGRSVSGLLSQVGDGTTLSRETVGIDH